MACNDRSVFNRVSQHLMWRLILSGNLPHLTNTQAQTETKQLLSTSRCPNARSGSRRRQAGRLGRQEGTLCVYFPISGCVNLHRLWALSQNRQPFISPSQSDCCQLFPPLPAKWSFLQENEMGAGFAKRLRSDNKSLLSSMQGRMQRSFSCNRHLGGATYMAVNGLRSWRYNLAKKIYWSK